MTNDLAALSEAATQGKIAINPFRAWIDCVQLDEDGKPTPIAAMAWPTEYRSEDETSANAAFITALWNEYRAGRLVQIDREEPARKFILGQRVTKTKGSKWTGRVVGFYSTDYTPVGYCIESENEPGSVQIYPENAIAAILGDAA